LFLFGRRILNQDEELKLANAADLIYFVSNFRKPVSRGGDAVVELISESGARTAVGGRIGCRERDTSWRSAFVPLPA